MKNEIDNLKEAFANLDSTIFQKGRIDIKQDCPKCHKVGTAVYFGDLNGGSDCKCLHCGFEWREPCY